MSAEILFSPLRLGAIELRNRIVMAPMTRMRAGQGNAPTALNVEYYAQRASAGLIVTEGTAISPQGQGYPNAPGIYTASQIAGWRGIADAVHARGGKIVMQIAHNGRNSHSSLLPDGVLPVAPSPVPSNIPAFTSAFQPVPAEVPRALDLEELPAIVGAFRQAASNAIAAGFDGVELQGANSHLIEQFLENGTNQRTDAYGGAKENRARFLFEIVAQVSTAIGADRLGVRLSPFGGYGGIYDSNPLELFTYVIRELSTRGLAYLHVIEARGSEIGLTDKLNDGALNNAALFRPAFTGPLISAAAYTRQSAAEVLKLGHADAVAFGRSFVANPDLPDRIRAGAVLNIFDRSTAYGGGAHGYTDYPALFPPVRHANVGSAREAQPGREWLAILSRATFGDFALAFASEPVLEAAVLAAPVVGVPAIRAFFQATRGMYDRIAFTAQSGTGARTCLEWEGEYRGCPIAGATILIADPAGAIERVRLFYMPFDQLGAFSADLHRRLDFAPPGSP